MSLEPFILDPLTGHLAFVDTFHGLHTAKIVRLIGTTFVGTTKDTNFWAETVTGSGAVAQANGAITLTTGGTADSTVQYQSVRSARFIPAVTNVFRFVGSVSNTGSTNNIRNWGLFDANNGAFFQLSGTTLNIVTRAAGSDTAVASGSFNKGTFTIDTNIHSYEIRVSYVAYDFYVDERLVHSISILGSSVINSQNLNLPATLQNNNSGGGTSNVSISGFVATVYRLGDLETESAYKHITTAATYNCKYGAGRLHRIVLNNAGGTLFTIYDNTAASGNIIGIINTPATANALFLEYNLPFSIGLTIVTTGTWDATVVYE